jgi:hypothetical protein
MTISTEGLLPLTEDHPHHALDSSLPNSEMTSVMEVPTIEDLLLLIIWEINSMMIHTEDHLHQESTSVGEVLHLQEEDLLHPEMAGIKALLLVASCDY